MALRSSLRTAKSIASYASVKVSPVLTRSMAGLSGSVIELSSYLEKRISEKSSEYAASAASFDEVGRVVSVGDGIARVYGLNKVQAGEMVVFSSGLRGEFLSIICLPYTSLIFSPFSSWRFRICGLSVYLFYT